MARINDVQGVVARAPAAIAGTVTVYVPTRNRPFVFEEYAWVYESAEANVDNTFDFAIEYTTDGSTFVSMFTNANPNGLLDTGAVLDQFVNRGNAASSGAAAAAASVPTSVRVPANAVVRFTLVTAGTGTIPAVQLMATGHYV